ncbi:MAG: T9SS type A sorting domain-containing protein [Bacteroidales bacterium]
MKKYFLLLVCLLMSVAFAFTQNLKIYHNGNLLTNNQVLNITGGVNELINLPLHVKNTSSSTINVKLRKIEHTLVAGSENAFCYAEQCWPPTVYESPNFSVIPGNTIDTSFLADYNAKGGSGTSIIRYVFFNIAVASDTVSVIVNYTTALGLNDIKKSEVYISEVFPNPASNVANFTYALPKQTVSAKIVINNILGSVVTEVELNEQSGKKSINTSDLNAGIYFYSLIVNNKSFYTRKFFIKH